MIEKDFPDGERSRRWLSGAETTVNHSKPPRIKAKKKPGQ